MKFFVNTSAALLIATLSCANASAAGLVTQCSNFKNRTRQPEATVTLQSLAPGALTPIPLDTVRMLDKKTAKQVFVQSVDARRTRTQTVEVMTRVLNCTKHPIEIVARTHFFDANQYPTEPASAWHLLVLQPGALTVYSERSIGAASVANFHIEMQLN
jgi:hypothetical protein